jgi:hypothetical protein
MLRDVRRQRAQEPKRAGAALVEALVVSCTTLIFFAGVWFMHDIVHQKSVALRAARHQAWAATRFDCGERSVVATDSQTVTVPIPMRVANGGGTTMSAAARTEMACNVQPRNEDTPIAALLSMLDLGSVF